MLRLVWRDGSGAPLGSAYMGGGSHPGRGPDPVPQLGDAGVHAGLVAARAALPPAHDARLEPLPTLLETHQGPAGVTLGNGERGTEETDKQRERRRERQRDREGEGDGETERERETERDREGDRERERETEREQRETKQTV